MAPNRYCPFSEQSINVTTYKPVTDKRARVIMQTDLFAGGSILLPRKGVTGVNFLIWLYTPSREDPRTLPLGYFDWR